MSALSTRPKVTDLVYQLYGRALHPELFETHSTRTVERGGYHATIKITTTGHWITWNYMGQTLTEVATSAAQPLPQKRRLLSHRLHGNRADETRSKGVLYQTSFQLETVDPEVFWTFQTELSRDGQRRGLLHTFDPCSRMALGALSYINVETRQRTMLVQAFHTFPEDRAIVKSQSLIEFPEG